MTGAFDEAQKRQFFEDLKVKASMLQWRFKSVSDEIKANELAANHPEHFSSDHLDTVTAEDVFKVRQKLDQQGMQQLTKHIELVPVSETQSVSSSTTEEGEQVSLNDDSTRAIKLRDKSALKTSTASLLPAEETQQQNTSRASSLRGATAAQYQPVTPKVRRVSFSEDQEFLEAQFMSLQSREDELTSKLQRREVRQVRAEAKIAKTKEERDEVQSQIRQFRVDHAGTQGRWSQRSGSPEGL